MGFMALKVRSHCLIQHEAKLSAVSATQPPPLFHTAETHALWGSPIYVMLAKIISDLLPHCGQRFFVLFPFMHIISTLFIYVIVTSVIDDEIIIQQ